MSREEPPLMAGQRCKGLRLAGRGAGYHPGRGAGHGAGLDPGHGRGAGFHPGRGAARSPGRVLGVSLI